MAQILAPAMAAVLSLSSIGFGFQILTPGEPTSASSRTQPRSIAAPDTPAGAIQVESVLVQVPVHVTNSLGANVAGLGRKDFELWDNGVKQSITYFSMDDAPASVGLVYDCSGSMRGKIGQQAAAAEAFMRTANPEDEFFLVEFNNRPRLAVPFTPQPGEILGLITRTRPAGTTALLDALSLAAGEMKKARNSRKALVILSDGGDNWSRHRLHQVKEDLVEADLQVYAMGIYAFANLRKVTSEEKNGPKLLDELAEETGGRMFPVNRLDELTEISTRISHELRTVYLLGYLPDLKHDGKYHEITVKTSREDVRLHFRKGYYAPQ